MEKIRVLLVGSQSSAGGIESFLINLFRKFDRSKFYFDFVVNGVNCKLIYEEEIVKNGSKVFYIPCRREGYLKRIKYFRSILRQGNYDVVHINIGSLYDSMPINECLSNGINKIILHAHSSNVSSKFNYMLHEINKLRFCSKNFIRLACSDIAGQWLYNSFFSKNKFEIIKNGIDINKFKYSEENRKIIRKLLKIDSNDFVLGNVGRLSDEKNHDFLINIFHDFHKIHNNSKLIIVGDGRLYNTLKLKIDNLNLSNSVLLLGKQNNIHEILSAMDIFLLPSFYEGLPITVVESQANGLMTLISDNVTNEVCVTDFVKKLPITPNNEKDWIEEILNFKEKGVSRFDPSSLALFGFELRDVVAKVESIYEMR